MQYTDYGIWFTDTENHKLRERCLPQNMPSKKWPDNYLGLKEKLLSFIVVIYHFVRVSAWQILYIWQSKWMRDIFALLEDSENNDVNRWGMVVQEI